MVNRFLEVMALALLVVLTISTTFQVLNYQLLAELGRQVRAERRQRAAGSAPVPAVPPQQAVAPGAAAPPAASAVRQAAQAAPPTTPAPAAPTPKAAIQSPVAANPPQAAPGSAATAPKAPPLLPPAAPAQTPAPARGADSSDPPEWTEHAQLVRRIIDDLFAGRYEPVIAQMTPDLAQGFTPEVLGGAIERTRAKYGDPQPADQGRLVESITGPDTKTFRLRLPTRGGKTILFNVSLTADKKIAGLWLK